jgi:magnesium-transporting ATPase (P-type)
VECHYYRVYTVQRKRARERQQITDGFLIRELHCPSKGKIKAKIDEVKPKGSAARNWRRLAKYFGQGIGFSLLVSILTYASMDLASHTPAFVTGPSPFLVVIMGFAVVVLLVLMIGLVNSAITARFWFRVETSLLSIILQGIALFVALWIVGIPFSLASFAFPGIATILVVLILQGFVDGFVCKKVAETWRRDIFPAISKAPAH